MQSNFSKLLAISGLIMLTRTVDSVSSSLSQKKVEQTSSEAFIQALDTEKRTAIAEWNGACNRCSG